MPLFYKSFGEGFPVVILHGLFGSLDNWNTIAKRIAEQGYQTFIVDLRNHGRSPHSEAFSYDLLSQDLLEFFTQHQIQQAHVIGHSMGGKAAMQFALNHSKLVSKLVVVDITPAAYSDQHAVVFEALFAVPLVQISERKQAEEILRKYLHEDGTVQFLMKNLYRKEDGRFSWRFNLLSLHINYATISGNINGGAVQTPALFIAGEQSRYIHSGNYASIDAHFTNHQIEVVKGAGHWVHADQPEKFVEVVLQFLR